MKVINSSIGEIKTVEELKAGDCYIFHGRIYMKIDLPEYAKVIVDDEEKLRMVKEQFNGEQISLVTDPSSGKVIFVKNSAKVKLINPVLKY